MKAPVPFDARDGAIWMDGALHDWKEARIHVLTHGLHYASCVYEGERAYQGRVFKLSDHTRRLFRSAEHLGFNLPYSEAEIEGATQHLLEANGISDGYVRPIAWRGSEQISTSARHSRIHVALACWSWPSYFDPAARMAGISMQTAAWRRPPPAAGPFAAKASAHYMIATLSKHQAEDNGYDDALLLDWRGQVAEATSANVFFVHDGVLHTPTADCFLDGITRQTVIALAREQDIKVVERAIWPSELASFSECFITGTAAEVCPVRKIDDIAFAPAEMCERFVNAYAAAVNNQS